MYEGGSDLGLHSLSPKFNLFTKAVFCTHQIWKINGIFFKLVNLNGSEDRGR